MTKIIVLLCQRVAGGGLQVFGLQVGTRDGLEAVLHEDQIMRAPCFDGMQALRDRKSVV